MKRIVAAWLAFVVAGTAAVAGPVREIRNTLGASVNLLGVQNNFDATWTWKLSRSESPLLSGAHVSLGLSDSLSPAYNRVAAFVEVSPLSILDIRAGVEPAVYFGTYASLLEFSGYADAYDQGTRNARNPGSFAGTAGRFFLSPTLKMKVGHFVALAGAELEWWRAGGDTTYFYEPTRDMILKSSGDSMIQTTAVLLYEIRQENGGSWLFGPIHNRLDVGDAPGNRIDRVGLLVVRDLAERRFGVKHPTVILNVQYYATDRYKQGELTATVAVRVSLGR